jgi:ribosomal protein S18 acetylase RimI-like enzyme
VAARLGHDGAMADENPADEAVAVRPLEERDVDEVLAMFGAVVDEGLWLGTEPGFDRDQRRARMAAAVGDPSRRGFVAVAGRGVIVGNASMAVAGYGVADIGMAVAEGWRGRGVGGRLLDALLAAAPSTGAHKVALEVWPHNERAIALYRSRGFEVEGRLRRHYRRSDGELWDAIVMGRVLDTDSPGSPHGG